MDAEVALNELSTAHAVALRMRDDGAGHRQIAVALGVPVESVPMLLRLAEAKLAALRRERSGDGVASSARQGTSDGRPGAGRDREG